MPKRSVKKLHQNIKSQNGQRPSGHRSLDVDEKNKDFINIAVLLSTDIPITTFTGKMKRLEITMLLNETHINEITTSFQSLRNKHSTGPFGIENGILKHCSLINEPNLCKTVQEFTWEQNFSWLSQDCKSYPGVREKKMWETKSREIFSN